MATTPDVVIKDLKANKYSPVYFLQGEESYYIDLIANHIEENALEESAKSFNQVVVYGKDASMSQILNNAMRYPMMSDRQVVIVREAQDIPDLGKEDGQRLLENYLKNPQPSTILVFCHKYKTVDGRKSIGKILDKFAVFVTSKKLYDNQVVDWIVSYLKAKGFSINDKAKQMLADHIGNNLERLSNEIDKMLINFKDKKEIDPGMVQRYIGISKDYNVFELQKALMVKDIFKANQIANYFGANPKSNPIIPTVALLFALFSKILLIHHTKDKSESNLAKILGIGPYFVKEYLIAARNYPLGIVIRNIGHLRTSDMQSKGIGSGSLSEGQILKELIFNLLH
jgi:DNA polymerase III subunit delta